MAEDFRKNLKDFAITVMPSGGKDELKKALIALGETLIDHGALRGPINPNNADHDIYILTAYFPGGKK